LLPSPPPAKNFCWSFKHLNAAESARFRPPSSPGHKAGPGNERAVSAVVVTSRQKVRRTTPKDAIMAKENVSIGTETPTGKPLDGPTGPYVTDDHDDEVAAAARRPAGETARPKARRPPQKGPPQP
jgi:hypothetical protein